MANFRYELTEPAADFFNRASADDQRELDRIFTNLCMDPYIDMKVKVAFNYPPAVGAMYVHERFRVLYHILKNSVVAIISIWHPRGGRFDNPQET